MFNEGEPRVPRLLGSKAANFFFAVGTLLSGRSTARVLPRLGNSDAVASCSSVFV